METSGERGVGRQERSVVSLPMRDGNLPVATHTQRTGKVVSLPMRDGNFPETRKDWLQSSC